ncbi:hypothetical protein BDV26DRAFT_41573 [Aspergillus bertholletiae]|uniref:Uncharacterized protein n=1 Tax=Aspergillus bertholletiae TaxID=1226010 RepID=A0A5N7AXH0_9EURO|nr:hypothetical protein BDV26DRAFT_41573 [Aspergillus bertholletiae]
MIVPKPPVKLEDHCSVIYDNTLYTYSANGFASISLERNATWTQLPMGQPVSKAACVTGGLDGNEDQQALYVIGGTPSKGESSGLQRYSFKDKKWTTIDGVSGNMANRTSHKAVYLKSSSALLIYGGHQHDETDASSATFAINTQEPYNLSAYSAEKASPAYDPVLLPWNDKEAALVGGLTTPDEVHLFDLIQGWHSSDATIPAPLSDGVQCALINGTDGSKILEAFDMSSSPNNVTSITLLNSDGNPAHKGNSSETPSTKRGITLDDYPTYDDSLAPTTTRKDYSLAQGNDGLVVISSGSGTDTLAIFNQTSNSWVNTTKLFYGDQSSQQILASTTSTPTATASGSSETSSAPASDDSSSSDVGTIIGATLGGIVGIAAILIVILFILKHKKDAKKRAAQGQGGDKDRLSFQDRGVEPLTRSAYPMAKSPAPLAASSVDSLAIFSGHIGEEKSPKPAGAPPSFDHKPSPLSTIQSTRELSSGEFDKAIEAQDTLPGSHPGDRGTSEGWGRYFQDTSAAPLMVPPAAVPARPDSTATTATAWPMKTLAPLNTNFLEAPKPLGCVVSGSPTTEHATSPKNGQYITIPESQSARISTASEITIESIDDEEHHGSRAQQSWLGRPPSSTYSRSYYNQSYYNSSTSDVPSLVAPLRDPRMNTRGSSVLIPESSEPVPQRDARNNNGNNINSDMSWLNLNGER